MGLVVPRLLVGRRLVMNMEMNILSSSAATAEITQGGSALAIPTSVSVAIPT